jgi:hypothetical protein
MIEIYDNLLEESYIKRLEQTLLLPGFPWYYTPSTVYGETDLPSLLHTFTEEGKEIILSEYTSVPYNLLDLFSICTGHEIEKIIRIRANLVLPNASFKKTGAHVDQEEPHCVIIYYANNVDGNTVLLNKDGSILKEVEPRAGRFLMFDGSLYHYLRIPTATRVVLNYNVILK